MTPFYQYTNLQLWINGFTVVLAMYGISLLVYLCAAIGARGRERMPIIHTARTIGWGAVALTAGFVLAVAVGGVNG